MKYLIWCHFSSQRDSPFSGWNELLILLNLMGVIIPLSHDSYPPKFTLLYLMVKTIVMMIKSIHTTVLSDFYNQRRAWRRFVNKRRNLKMGYHNRSLQVPLLIPLIWNLSKITAKQLIYNRFIGCKSEVIWHYWSF